MASCCCVLRKQLGLETLRELGKGGQGLVLLCTDARRSIHLACKIIPSHLQEEEQSIASRKRKLQDTEPTDFADDQVSSRTRKLSAEELFQDSQLRWEADVLQHLSGIPGVLPLVSTVQGDDGCFHLLTPFCDAGDLLGKLDSRPPQFKLDDREAAPIVASLARTLAACHLRGIVHRDVKPGNVLLRRVEGADYEDVFLADFGLAATIAPGQILHDCVGTSRYQAPEVIQGTYDHRADAWSLGVVLHLLLTSALPFIQHLPHDAPDSAIHDAILCNELELSAFGLSPSAQDLLTSILCKDPDSRLTLDEILSHPWLIRNTQPIIDVKQAVSQSVSVDDTAPCKFTRKVGIRRRKTQHRGGMVRGSAHPHARSVVTSRSGLPQPIDHDADHEDDAGTAKITRVRIPMDRKCYRQQWAAAVRATAAGFVC